MPDVAQVLAGDPAQVLAPAPAPVALPMGVEERKRRAKIAEALAMQSMDVSPVQSWTQGAARVANGLVGALEERKLDQGERASADRLNKLLLSNPALGGSGGAAPAAAPASAPASSSSLDVPATVGAGVPPNDAISSIESGGKYNSLGIVIPKTGDRAYGKYQVMGANVPAWTREHYGQELTPEQFLGNPDAQEAVFKGEFGKYVGKYGPEGAARAWFAGEPNMNNLNAKDPLGTTVGGYGQKFAALTGGATATDAAPGAPPAGPQGVPAALSAAFQPGTPSMAAPTPQNAPAPAAGPAAAAAAPGAPPAAARMQTAMDPQMQGWVKKLIMLRDPAAAALAQKIMEQYSKPAELKPMIAGTKGYTFNPATGQWTQAVDADKPKYTSFEGGRVLEEGSGKVTTPDSAAGFRPLVAPEDRAKFGIPETDKRPYQVDAGGKLINPPAETRLNIDQRGESAFSTHAGQLQAKRFDDLVRGGQDAKSMISDLNFLRDVGSRITTGKSAEFKTAIGPYAEMAGVKVDGLPDLQAYNAVVAKLQPRMRVAGSGATSDYEMRQFLAALPSLGKTPEGNAMIANTLEALQQQHLAAAEIGSRALSGELKPHEAEKQLRELPDPFQLWKKSHGGKSASAPVKTSTGVTYSIEQ